MMLQSRIQRALDQLKKRRAQRKLNEEEPLPLEKGDMAALHISALITIIPIALAVLLIMAGIPWLLRR